MTEITLNSIKKIKSERKFETCLKKENEIVVINNFLLNRIGDVDDIKSFFLYPAPNIITEEYFVINILHSDEQEIGHNKFTEDIFKSKEEAYDFLISKGYTPIKNIELNITI